MSIFLWDLLLKGRVQYAAIRLKKVLTCLRWLGTASLWSCCGGHWKGSENISRRLQASQGKLLASIVHTEMTLDTCKNRNHCTDTKEQKARGSQDTVTDSSNSPSFLWLYTAFQTRGSPVPGSLLTGFPVPSGLDWITTFVEELQSTNFFTMRKRSNLAGQGIGRVNSSSVARNHTLLGPLWLLFPVLPGMTFRPATGLQTPWRQAFLRIGTGSELLETSMVTHHICLLSVPKTVTSEWLG